jgi:predicted Zn-dependent protease
MDKLARFQGASVPEFLRSHPLHSSRISDALVRADQYPSKGQITGVRNPEINFYLMRTRIQVLTTENPAELVERFRGNLRSGKSLSTYATQYGLALALFEDSKYEESVRLLKSLLQHDGERIPYYLAMAHSMQKLRGADSGQNVLNRALEIYPSNLILSLAAIDIYIANKQAKLAEKILRPLLNRQRDKPELYERLSRIASALKRPSEAYLARAEGFYLRGHLGTAIEQLEQAQRLPLRNENIGLRVASRLKQIKKELKEQNKSSTPEDRKSKP